MQELVNQSKLDAVEVGNKVLITLPSIAALLHKDPEQLFVKSDNSGKNAPVVESKVMTEKDGGSGAMVKGSISKLKSGRLIVQIDLGRDEKGKRIRENKSFRLGQEAEAEVYLQERLTELNGKTEQNGANSPLTFEQYCMQYLRAGGSGRATSQTIENYRASLKCVNPYLGKILIAKLTIQDLNRAFSKIDTLYGTESISKTYRTIKMILQYAYEQGDIETDVVKTWKKPKSRKPQEKEKFEIYTEEELKNIFDLAQKYNYMLYTKFILLYSTGMRPEEMRALEWTDIDFEKKQVHINKAVSRKFEETGSIGAKAKQKAEISKTKTDYSKRNLPLPAETIRVLQTYHDMLKSDKNKLKAQSNYIFPNKKGSFCTPHGCESAVKRFRKKFSLQGVYYYKFRHTYCTNLILANQPIPVIQRLMGDNSPKVIMDVYTHVNNKKAVENAQDYFTAMNEWLAGMA